MKCFFVFITVIFLAMGFPCTGLGANTCHVVMEGEITTNFYENVADAIRAIGTGTGVVTMIANDVITSTNRFTPQIDIDGHVTIVSDGGDHTITRGATGVYSNFSLLYVCRFKENTNAVLTLGAPAMTGTLTFDGGSFLTKSSCIILCYRGTLNMYDGITLKNNISEYGGSGVYNEGIFNMYGGLIVSNTAYGTGGGVQNGGYYGQTCVFNMYGGAISWNKSLNGANGWGGYGGGVSIEGAATFNMYGGTIDGNEAEFAGGGVNNTQESQSGTETATFNMTGGTISGNSVTDENGLGAGVYNDDVMTIEGDAVIDADNDVYLDDAVIIVTGELTGGGTVASITTSNTTSGTPVVTVSGGAGVTLEDVLGSFALGSGSDEELAVDPDTGAIILATPLEAWLLRRGHGLNDPDFASDADIDEDGATTLHEFIADTDPANPSSVLRAGGREISLNQVLSFPASTGRVYSLYYRAELGDGNWQPVLENVQGTNTTMSLTDTNKRERVYYRVEAQRLP